MSTGWRSLAGTGNTALAGDRRHQHACGEAAVSGDRPARQADRARTGPPAVQAVPQLTRHGLSVHADLIYRCLAQFGEQAAPTLARALDLSTGHVMAALEELAGGGAVKADLPRRVWTAMPPSAFLDGLRERRARLAAARHALLRNMSIVDIAGVTVDRLAHASPITDVGLARRRFDEVITAASTEFLAMNPETAFTRASAKAAVPADRSALTNGARTLSLGVPAGDDDESDAYAGELLAYGLEYRELPHQPVKVWIVDRRTAFFPVDPAANFRNGVWELSSPSIIDELVAFFLRRWDVAEAPAPGWRPPHDLGERERAVLAALALGDTDEMAARRLRLSSRTVRYVVRDLMDRYQVTTRFQLGLVVGRITEGADR
jgi:DNA-binding CsgD family transcriptional regulator